MDSIDREDLLKRATESEASARKMLEKAMEITGRKKAGAILRDRINAFRSNVKEDPEQKGADDD